jgi:hypothetical protein
VNDTSRPLAPLDRTIAALQLQIRVAAACHARVQQTSAEDQSDLMLAWYLYNAAVSERDRQFRRFGALLGTLRHRPPSASRS